MKTITLQRAAGGGYTLIDVQIVADIRDSVADLAANLGSGAISCIYDIKGTGIDQLNKMGVPLNIDEAGSVANILDVTEADGSFTVIFSDGDSTGTFAGY
jgi:hypothetical protein